MCSAGSSSDFWSLLFAERDEKCWKSLPFFVERGDAGLVKFFVVFPRLFTFFGDIFAAETLPLFSARSMSSDDEAVPESPPAVPVASRAASVSGNSSSRKVTKSSKADSSSPVRLSPPLASLPLSSALVIPGRVGFPARVALPRCRANRLGLGGESRGDGHREQRVLPRLQLLLDAEEMAGWQST